VVWEYVPGSHKTEHHGKERVVPIGPKGQAVLKEWVRPDAAAFLFSPAEAMAEFRAGQRRVRKTPVQPSQRRRSKRNPRRRPGDRYTPESYCRAIARACKKAGIDPPWHPHRLRHSAATMLRREFGLDVARTVLGHNSPAATAIYAAADHEKAAAAIARVG
jgi:integrase